MKKILFVLITLITISNFGHASFPVLETEKAEIAIEKNVSNEPWYISFKNSLMFLATSVLGFVTLGVFLSEGFIARDRGGLTALLLIPLLVSTAAFFASVFYGKKIWGSSIRFGDPVAKKIVIWAISITTFFFLLANLIFSGGTGMGG
tara:strand:+ start:90 stop:533 length:444 start_codon:yes stop_codon:yes gene_type:complete